MLHKASNKPAKVEQSLPVIRASGLDCSFLHAGTNTVTSLWPLSKNQSTANLIPRHENTSLFPWLKQTLKFLIIGLFFCYDSKQSTVKRGSQSHALHLLLGFEGQLGVSLSLAQTSHHLQNGVGEAY